MATRYGTGFEANVSQETDITKAPTQPPTPASTPQPPATSPVRWNFGVWVIVKSFKNEKLNVSVDICFGLGLGLWVGLGLTQGLGLELGLGSGI